jgi:hypothetical protein
MIVEERLMKWEDKYVTRIIMAGRGRCWACRQFPGRETTKIPCYVCIRNANRNSNRGLVSIEDADAWPSKHWSEATWLCTFLYYDAIETSFTFCNIMWFVQSVIHCLLPITVNLLMDMHWGFNLASNQTSPPTYAANLKNVSAFHCYCSTNI